MNINISWRSPIYEEKYVYSKQRTVKTVVEPCKGILLLQVSVKGLGRESAEFVYNQLMGMLGGVFVSENLLSAKEWGVASSYDCAKKMFTDSFCIPKDYNNYDSIDAQKKAIVQEVRECAKEIRETSMFVECDDSDNYICSVRP